MIGYYGQGVPTSGDLENNSNQKKYTVNKVPKGHLVISKVLCALMALGALVLIALAAVATFFLLPKCSDATPEALLSNLQTLDTTTHIDKRLPRSIEPSHYRIKLVPYLEGNFTTDGYVIIKFNVTDDTRKIIFNLKDIEINEESIKVKKSSDKVIKITNKEYDSKSERYTLTTEDILLNREQYELEMKFTGHLNDYMQGFYRSSYESNHEIRWMASTQFSPTDARRAFPCFDEPSFKAKFTISIARSKNMTALSNMPINKTEAFSEKDGWVWDHFEETPLMSSYLVAFVVSDLQPFLKKSANINYTIWSRRETIDQTFYALDLLPRILEYFESYFEVKYPLKKLDVVAIPDFGFSAMENWGLITFRETALLYQDKTSTIEDKRNIALIIAHELCHQWFGNLVTPAWWDDLWLKEGFANYFNYKGASNIKYLMDEFPLYEIRAAFAVDSLESSRPISFNIKNNDEIRQAFDPISYSKGASLLRMLNHVLGEDTFKNGLIKYLNKYQYNNANHDNLWDCLTEQAHEDDALDLNMTIKEVMDNWTLKPGFPVINARRNASTVYITQHRFLKTGKIDKDTLWHVPISHTSGDDPNLDDTKPKLWLSGEEETSFTLETQTWYLLNLQQTGYYIVNYDERNWKSLIRHADKSLSAVIKGQLICDSMDLAAAGLLEYAIPLRLISSMSQNLQDNLVPFMAMFDKLQLLKDILSNTEAYGNFEEFIYTKFDAVFKSVDLNNNRRGDTYQSRRLANLALPWACLKSDSRCALTSHRLFRDWMTSGISVKAAKPVVYCTAIRVGGDAEWDFAFKEYSLSNVPTEKNILLSALGCTTKPWVLVKYLNMLLKNDTIIRKQDGAKVFSAVASNIVGNSIAFDFLQSKWKEINDYYGNGFGNIARMIMSLPQYMNTQYQLSLLKEFKEKNAGNLGTSEQAINRAIEDVARNVQWMNKNYKSVEMWLENFLNNFRFRK